MARDVDHVGDYGRSLGWKLRPRTILVEGTTDVDFFRLAGRLEREETGIDLFGDELTVIAAGEREQGGALGVCRELICLRGIARTNLLRNGRPRYRFIGLFDNDKAGRETVKVIRRLDASILEYKDVFRLMPIMPKEGNLDPKTLERTSQRLNAGYNGLDWEVEDLLSHEFIDAFVVDYPYAVRQSIGRSDVIHREFTPDGKARLHRYVRENAMHVDLKGVVQAIRALRFYLRLPAI